MDNTVERYNRFCPSVRYKAIDGSENEHGSNRYDHSTYDTARNHKDVKKREQNDTPKNFQKCAGKDCGRMGKTILSISYINKAGLFCDSCAEDLLREGLASKIANTLYQ